MEKEQFLKGRMGGGAGLLIESDVSMKLVQELLGHSTITTSMDIYTHVSDQMKEKAIGQVSHRDGNVV